MLQAAKADLMLTAKDLSQIRALVNEEACASATFEQLSKAQAATLSKVDTFRLGSVYGLLLEHSDLIAKPGQKVAALFLLWDLYKEDHAWKNPFANLFIRLVQRSAAPNSAFKLLPSETKFRELTDVFDHMQFGVAKLNDAETYFLKLLMLGNSTRELWSKKPLEISSMDFSRLPALDLTSFFEGYKREQSFNTQLQHCSVPAILDDRDESIVSHRSERVPISPYVLAQQQQQQMGGGAGIPGSPGLGAGGGFAGGFAAGGGGGNLYPARDSVQEVLETLLTGAKPYSDLFIRPEMIIPPPELEPLEPHELAFLEPLDLHNYLQFEWDENMCANTLTAGNGSNYSADNGGSRQQQQHFGGDDANIRGGSGGSLFSGVQINAEQAVQLLHRAGEVPLNVEERQQLIAALHRNPMLAFAASTSFSPMTLPTYIEKNPVIAAEVLRVYFLVPPSSPTTAPPASASSPGLASSSPGMQSQQQQQQQHGVSIVQQHKFMEQLLRLEVSLQYMEAVTQLLTLGAMPVQLLKAIIAHCIQTCQASSNANSGGGGGDFGSGIGSDGAGGDSASKQQQSQAQARLVQLVCLFLMSALQARPLDFDVESNPLMRDTIYEVQAFCIEYSRVKEASQLFRMLNANFELPSSSTSSASAGAAAVTASSPPRAHHHQGVTSDT